MVKNRLIIHKHFLNKYRVLEMQSLPNTADRLLAIPKFGDTVTNLSLKVLRAVNEGSQPIFLAFRSYSQTFGQVLKRYLLSAQPPHPMNSEYTIEFLKTHELISENKRLQIYKQEIGDAAEAYFRIYPADTQKMIHINEELRSAFAQSPSSKDPASNITVVVRKPNGQEAKITICKYSKIKVLKLQVCKNEHLDENQFSLVYAGKKLQNQQSSLIDHDIEDDSLIMLVMIVKLGCFSPNALIRLPDNSCKKICELKVGEQVLSYNEKTKRKETDEIISIHRTKLSSFLQITFENGGIVKCTSNHRFLTDRGWKSFCFQQDRQRLRVGDSLNNYEQSATKITKIDHINNHNPYEFFHISTLNNHTFFLNNIISHNMEVKFLNTANGTVFSLNLIESDTIQMVKLRVSEAIKLSKHQILIVLNKRQLKDNQSISDYIQDIKNCNYLEVIQHEQHTIVVNRLKTKREYRFKLDKEQSVRDLKKQIYAVTDVQGEYQILILNNTEMFNGQKIGEFQLHKNFNRVNLIEIQEQQVTASRMASNMKKILYVRIEENDYLRLNYFSLRQMRVQQFICSFVPNSKKSYSLLFGEVILSPSDYLKSIEEHAIFNNQEINCYVVKCYDRIAFYRTLNFSQKFDLKTLGLMYDETHRFEGKDVELKEKLTKKDYIYTIKAKFNEQLQQFYRPIQIYTTQTGFKRLQNYLQKVFTMQHSHIPQLEGYNFCSSLVKSLESIPAYIGQTHKLLPSIRFKDIYEKRGDTLYFQSFLSTHSHVQSIHRAGLKNYTLLHIQSLTGKPIGLISGVADEVVFLPFSYFYLTKLTHGPIFDEAWVIQVPTAISFQKDIFMWVDDQPNSKQNRQICNLIDFSKFELVQLVSTEIAQYWMKEFNWILKWGGHKIKVMSDMNRVEGEDNVMVHEAGINLVQSFHNDLGYTAPIFIYCKNLYAGRKAMQARKIKPGRIQKITNDQFELINYLTSE